MANNRPGIKEKHPNWFKMKIERRELIRQLAPETAVNVLLACWEYLETGEKPKDLSPIENIAFATFIPDMEEAWSRYLQRVSIGAKGGRPRQNRTVSYDTVRSHTGPYGIEEEIEPEIEPEPESETESKKECVAAKPPTRPRFVPPTVDEVRAYCRDIQSSIDPERFVDYYQTRGWKCKGGQPMKDWKAGVRSWEKREPQRSEYGTGEIALSDLLKGFHTEDEEEQ